PREDFPRNPRRTPRAAGAGADARDRLERERDQPAGLGIEAQGSGRIAPAIGPIRIPIDDEDALPVVARPVRDSQTDDRLRDASRRRPPHAPRAAGAGAEARARVERERDQRAGLGIEAQGSGRIEPAIGPIRIPIDDEDALPVVERRVRDSQTEDRLRGALVNQAKRIAGPVLRKVVGARKPDATALLTQEPQTGQRLATLDALLDGKGHQAPMSEKDRVMLPVPEALDAIEYA